VLGVDRLTLYRWRDAGKIKCERTTGGRLLWDVAGYLDADAVQGKTKARATS
jgi:predicted site-specific integrase-resolvase